MLQVDGQHWFMDMDYWKIVRKGNREELFFYPDDDTEIYIGSRPGNTKNFILEENIDTRSFTELAAAYQNTKGVVSFPSEAISDFYNGLTEEQKNKLGNLDALIEEYEDIPFDQPVEDYIETLKCKL